MPSATNSTMASSSSGKAGPGGNEQAPAAAAAAPQASGGSITSVQTEAMKQILGVIDKKLRNLEKKKVLPSLFSPPPTWLPPGEVAGPSGSPLGSGQLPCAGSPYLAVSGDAERMQSCSWLLRLSKDFFFLSQVVRDLVKTRSTAVCQALTCAKCNMRTVVNSLQQQTQATSPPVPEPHTLTTVAQADPLVRRQRVQDLMAQMQGPYNFMQDSMLEFENQTLDPAIVSAQPMNPAQNLDMPQMVCPPGLTGSRSVPVQVTVPLVSSTSEGYTASQPMYQPSHTTEQRPQKESIDQIQASMSLNADQTPSSSSLPTASQPQVFQAGSSKPLHSSGINVNAAPFQSMQTVFNMNAPVPPVNEPETLKQQNQYQASYNQSFSNQPHQVEQSDLQQEQLQTVVKEILLPDFSYTYISTALLNQENVHVLCHNFSIFMLQDGYQQNFKRGSGQSGPRGAPRGRGGPPRPNRGMPQMNAQQVN
uniref:Cell cycle associated protein 1 n=1 Tax=Pavo cristatus TaxID=9049 RepID=A0A8C9EK76_PAVCR